MHRKIFIEQLKRSKKTVVYFWLLLIAATFFVTSMNLYRNSIRVGNGIMQENIEEIEMDMSQENDLSALTEQESDIRIAADPLVTLQASGIPTGICVRRHQQRTAGTSS